MARDRSGVRTLHKCNKLKAMNRSWSFQCTAGSPGEVTVRPLVVPDPADRGCNDIADERAYRVTLVECGAHPTYRNR